ncbi:MAG: ImmA/IrrE family metallo-endopeptidase [Ruminococcus flavefaciens]|nr:ImmA/IrrE family metallo-endopeptidase [Ruminococcus flavefaciens]
MTKAELYKTVSRIKYSLKISPNCYPLDMFELCSRINGLEVEKAPFKTRDLRGMLCVANNSNENSVILINSNKSPQEQNYHCAHEFIHLFGDEPSAGTLIKCYDSVKPNQNKYAEWFANEGAAEFLVPYTMLLPMIKEKYTEIITQEFGVYSFCHETAEAFNVSPVVLENRLKNLKYEIHQYLNGTHIDKINILSMAKQIENNIDVKSLIDIKDEGFDHLLTLRNRNICNTLFGN